MDTSWQKNYSRVLGTLFLVFFALFGGMVLLGQVVWPDFADSVPLPFSRLGSALLAGLGAGWGFAGMFGGFWLVFRFIGQRPV